METNNKIAELQKQFDANMEMIFLISKSKILDLVLAEKEKSTIIEKLIYSNLRIYGEILREINTKIGANEQDNQQDQNKQQINKDETTIKILKNIIEIIEYKLPVIKSFADYKFQYKGKTLSDYIHEIRENKYNIILVKNRLFAGFKPESLLLATQRISTKHEQDIQNIEQAMASLRKHNELQKDNPENNRHKHNNEQSHDTQNDKQDNRKTLLSKTIGIMIPMRNTNGVDFINASNTDNKKIDVLAFIKENGCTGTAKCNPEDTFDLEIGFCVAFARAVLGENYNNIIKDIKDSLKIEE